MRTTVRSSLCGGWPPSPCCSCRFRRTSACGSRWRRTGPAWSRTTGRRTARAATSGSTLKNSADFFLKGYYWTGGVSTGTQSRLVNKAEDVNGKSSLYIYCGPTAGDTLIGYFSNIAYGTNPGLNLQNGKLHAVSTITFQTATTSLLDMQGGDISNVDDLTMAGSTSLLDMQRAPISNCGALTGYAADNPNITGFNNITMNGTTFRIAGRRTITNANDAGNDGDVCFDTNYIYCCVGASTWKRAALSTW